MANEGGSPCRFHFGLILTPGRRGRRPSGPRMARRRAGSWPSQRFTTALHGRRPPDRRRDAADRSRLGAEVQRARAGWSHRPQGADARLATLNRRPSRAGPCRPVPHCTTASCAHSGDLPFEAVRLPAETPFPAIARRRRRPGGACRPKLSGCRAGGRYRHRPLAQTSYGAILLPGVTISSVSDSKGDDRARC